MAVRFMPSPIINSTISSAWRRNFRIVSSESGSVNYRAWFRRRQPLSREQNRPMPPSSRLIHSAPEKTNITISLGREPRS